MLRQLKDGKVTYAEVVWIYNAEKKRGRKQIIVMPKQAQV